MTNKQEKMICNTFGISKLKPFQKKVITDLSDGKDVLGLARTSEGKSICFLSMITLHPNGLLIGILPTVALMHDLVQRCKDSKIRAGCLYSENRENTNTIEQLTHRKLQALFVAPERLSDPHLWKAIQKNSVHTVVVDEVHCLTEWGNEFRPMYRNIGKFIKDLPASHVIAAFSATVTPDDISYIAKSLRMKNPVVHIGKLKRSNLSLKKAFVKNDAARYAKVRKVVQKYDSKGKIVIYCTRVCDGYKAVDFPALGRRKPLNPGHTSSAAKMASSANSFSVRGAIFARVRFANSRISSSMNGSAALTFSISPRLPPSL